MYDQAKRAKEKYLLLCDAQAQDYGIIIYSKDQKYGGLQYMVINEDYELHIIPFTFEKGITIMTHRDPNDEEINTISILDVCNPERKRFQKS